jgi:ribose transport system substrate-binding protein
MNSHYGMVIDGCKEEIDRLGGAEFGELVVQAPSRNDTSIEEQFPIFENMLEQDFDVIALSTESDEAMLPYIERAAEAGVPVVMFNQAKLSEENTQYIANVSYSNHEANRLIGEWVANQFSEPTEIGVLEGYPSEINTGRDEGFQDGISTNPDLTIVASQPADWMREKAQSVTENMLTANPDIKCIAGYYDEMALGAIAAAKQMDKMDGLTVVGFDCTKDGIASIEAGELAATVDTGAKLMGNLIIDAAKRFVKDGETLGKDEYFNAMNEALKVFDKANVSEVDKTKFEYVPRKTGDPR